METELQSVRAAALALSPLARIQLVDSLVDSLDEPDVQLESLWTAEAESRLDAYLAGRVPPVAMPQALSDHYQQTQQTKSS
jgi:putative addiction module component (TIGR02574 family)